MEKRCLTEAAKKGVFNQNAIHKDIFEVTPESGSNLPFNYFSISLPFKPFLIQQGAKYVVESQVYTTKVLNTGLRRSKVNGILYGDICDLKTGGKSLIVFQSNQLETSYKVFLYEGYFPKSLNKVLNEIKSIGT
ncbi:MAG: hypothetical protein ACOYMA_19000 [Bacteroidia bacterium]